MSKIPVELLQEKTVQLVAECLYDPNRRNFHPRSPSGLKNDAAVLWDAVQPGLCQPPWNTTDCPMDVRVWIVRDIWSAIDPYVSRLNQSIRPTNWACFQQHINSWIAHPDQVYRTFLRREINQLRSDILRPVLYNLLMAMSRVHFVNVQKEAGLAATHLPAQWQDYMVRRCLVYFYLQGQLP